MNSHHKFALETPHNIPETVYLQKTTKSDVISSIKLHENGPAIDLVTTVKATMY